MFRYRVTTVYSYYKKSTFLHLHFTVPTYPVFVRKEVCVYNNLSFVITLCLLQKLTKNLHHRLKSGSKTAERNGKSRIRGWMSTAQPSLHLLAGGSLAPTPGACCTPTGSHTPSRGRDPTPRTFTTWRQTTTTHMAAWDIRIRDCGSDQGQMTLGSKRTKDLN